MEWQHKNIFFSGWLLLFVLLAGCATAPKSLKNPYLGYLYARSITGDTGFKQDGIPSQLTTYMEQMASEEFQKRYKQLGGAYNGKSLDKMEQYVAILAQPIVIGEDQWKGAIDDNLSKKEKKILMAYWQANQPFKLDGSKVLAEWENTRRKIESKLRISKRKVYELESDITRLRQEKRFKDALAKVELLRPYKSNRADELMKSLNKEASDYWAGKRILEIDKLRKASAYDSMHELKVLSLHSDICSDVEIFGHRKNFNGVFAEWQDLLGDNWRKRIVQMGASKEYWKAYKFARKRYFKYVDSSIFEKTYREGLRLKIGKGYLEILDNAVRHYSDLASNAYKLKSLSGKAYVYCCMAKEMYDFSTLANFAYHEDTETWYKRIAELEKNELLNALNARLSRRLIIQEFELDVLRLSKKLRQSFKEKYAHGNSHAWALEVVTKKVDLAKFEEGSLAIEPDDYMVEWNRADFKVKGKYGTPIPKTTYVRTDRINVKDNPFRKDKSSEFYKLKQVKAQEVDQYSLIESERGIDLSCNIAVSCEHRGRNEPLKFPTTEAIIKKFDENFKQVKNTTATCSLENVLSKTAYYAPDKPNNTIPRDVIPQNQVIEIPDEDSFKESLAVTIIKDLDNELQRLIDMYPMELLANSSQETASEQLDTLGTILFYIVNLSSTDAAKRESANKGYEWLNLRDQMADNMKAWCNPDGRWGAIEKDKKRIFESLWEVCVKAGLEQDDR